MTALPPTLAQYPELDVWLRIDPAETITLFTGKVELGQGLRAAIARIGAEELDVTLQRVRVETADTARGHDEGITAGSMSIEQSGSAIRQASAEARAYLLALAAERLGVEASALQVDDGTVRAAGGETTTYWDLLGGGRFGISAQGTVTPKPAADHRIIGKKATRPDLLGVVTGETRYVQDLALPGMLYGRVVRPPGPGSALEALDDSGARGLPGVVAIVRDGSFVGVVAEREEQAVRAADALAAAARWSQLPELPPADLPDWLKGQPGQSFLIVDGAGVDDNVPPIAVPAGAATTVRAQYTRPYTMHASIGPSAALAVWEGRSLTVWSATQGVFALRKALAEALRIDPDAVRVVHNEGAGCYGHNGSDDVSLDAALLARAVGERPVRVTWTREQEHVWEPYGPASVMELQASLSADGTLLDWNHDVWSTTHVGRAAAAPEGSSALVAAWHLADPIPPPRPRPMAKLPHLGIHRNADPLYAVPNKRVVKHFVEGMPLRVSSLRSLGAFGNVFAIESFMDELAEAADVDAIDFRLAYLPDERARAVLQTAAEHIGWAGRTDDFGSGIGIAFARYKNTACYAAVAVELEIDDATAMIELKRAVIAADTGQVIDPGGLENQLEGGFVQAASWTLIEQVTFDNARITSVDWETYPILALPDVPEITTILLDRPELPPLGAGEATQGPTPAAIANAVHRALGVRVRELPITPERLRAITAQRG